jgi:hypothetical protein
MIILSDNAREYITQYNITEKARIENKEKYKIERDKLFNILVKLKYNEYMGVCDKCNTKMLLQPVDEAWAAVCQCNEYFCYKTYTNY